MSEEEKEYVLKLLLLGDLAVGKTSLVNQFLEHSFEEKYQATLGVNLIFKDVEIEETNTKVRLILWDIAGQDKYEKTRKSYFEGCEGAMLVYDITRSSTFENIESKWLVDFKNYVSSKDAYILIGNKADLIEERTVTHEHGQGLAKKINAIDFIETSAKTGDNVEKAFINLVHQVLSKYKPNYNVIEMIGDYKGVVKNRVLTALLQAYLDVLDYDGLKSVLNEAGLIHLKNYRDVDPNENLDFFSFKKIISAQNCLLYHSNDLLFEIGKKFSFYLFPFGKKFEEVVKEINELIQTDWSVQIIEKNKKVITVKVEKCIFCSEIGISCDLFIGFLMHSLEKTLPLDKRVFFSTEKKDINEPAHNSFVVSFKSKKK